MISRFSVSESGLLEDAGLLSSATPEDGCSATTIDELDADGAATRKLHTNGWATRLFKLR